MVEATFWGITVLALLDSINPCAIAIMAMILIEILINNPQKKRHILYGGLAFVSAIFIGYLVYALVLIQLFSFIAEFLRSNAIYIYYAFGIIAMVIGALHIKDFLMYKKGSFGTEMPLFMRPKVKKIIKEVTSVKGAFITGFVVTFFLLPCTSGPLLVAAALLSKFGLIGSLPMTLWYDLVFVLPMLVITAIIFFGISEVDDVSSWKDRNVRILHFAAGILMFLVGIAILIGWI